MVVAGEAALKVGRWWVRKALLVGRISWFAGSWWEGAQIGSRGENRGR